jgi:hypothetical protein
MLDADPPSLEDSELEDTSLEVLSDPSAIWAQFDSVSTANTEKADKVKIKAKSVFIKSPYFVNCLALLISKGRATFLDVISASCTVACV